MESVRLMDSSPSWVASLKSLESRVEGREEERALYCGLWYGGGDGAGEGKEGGAGACRRERWVENARQVHCGVMDLCSIFVKCLDSMLADDCR